MCHRRELLRSRCCRGYIPGPTKHKQPDDSETSNTGTVAEANQQPDGWAEADTNTNREELHCDYGCAETDTDTDTNHDELCCADGWAKSEADTKAGANLDEL